MVKFNNAISYPKLILSFNKLEYITKFLMMPFRPDATAFKFMKTNQEGLIPQNIL